MLSYRGYFTVTAVEKELLKRLALEEPTPGDNLNGDLLRITLKALEPLHASASVEIFLFGIHCMLFAVSFLVLIRKRTTSNVICLAALVTMFVLSIADVALTVRMDMHDVPMFLQGQMSLNLVVSRLYPKGPIFIANNFLADLLLLYRCYIVWGLHKWALGFATVLLMMDTIVPLSLALSFTDRIVAIMPNLMVVQVAMSRAIIDPKSGSSVSGNPTTTNSEPLSSDRETTLMLSTFVTTELPGGPGQSQEATTLSGKLEEHPLQPSRESVIFASDASMLLESSSAGLQIASSPFYLQHVSRPFSSTTVFYAAAKASRTSKQEKHKRDELQTKSDSSYTADSGELAATIQQCATAIQDVPHDVPEEIFFQVLSSCYDEPPWFLWERMTVRAVCSTWNLVMLRSPRQRSDVFILFNDRCKWLAPLHAVRQWVSRSGKRQLSVYIEAPPPPCQRECDHTNPDLLQAYCDLLAQSVHCWKTFTLECCQLYGSSEFLHPFFGNLPFQSAAQLEHASIDFYPADDNVAERVLQMLGSISSLRSLEWDVPADDRGQSHFQILKDHFELGNLTSLSLTVTDLAPLVAVLRNTIALVHLQITSVAFHHYYNIETCNPIDLPYLQSLSLATSNNQHRFLLILNTPQLTVLAIQCSTSNHLKVDLQTSLRSFFSIAPPRLAVFILEYRDFNVRDIIKFVAPATIRKLQVMEFVCFRRFDELLERPLTVIANAESLSKDMKTRFRIWYDKKWGSDVFFGWADKPALLAFNSTPSLLVKYSANSYAAACRDHFDRWRRAFS
ncbi:hypothetical protein NP233_g2886 [Leucocoprinus birnbaumii]|uniref:Uncharacterized protein n=1 Tax=Leucocoprinus birnbaumii TaxID=56174 RepID=A0AAD5VZD2_9AGAR|nr:hypothetical protein NP233_g2886 [Leucocoprinus birnbaumii]